MAQRVADNRVSDTESQIVCHRVIVCSSMAVAVMREELLLKDGCKFLCDAKHEKKMMKKSSIAIKALRRVHCQHENMNDCES